ncbi:MAG: phytanoyl-CoA dioxygenase family protein [Acidimicrobiaceae bacterium]|nr:phytanoyl-CoA dioxygenase family protein [Acidimicrobiaceae bacterium]
MMARDRVHELETYERDGFVCLESFVTADWLSRLNAAMERLIDESRTAAPGDWRFDPEPDHTADDPRLRRINTPVDLDPTFAEFALDGPATDLAVDMLGPNVRFHHSKLNIKWSSGGEEVKWHQDIQFWPHTDFSPLTIGIYLNEVDDQMGPMGIVPGSHRGELFDLRADDGSWAGAIRDEDLDRADTATAVYLKGPAGSATVHNCCAIHGSAPNTSPRMRPLLLQTYSRADSYPLLGVGTNGKISSSAHSLVRGAAPDRITVGGRTMPAAPDWYKGKYTSIFAQQQGPDS